MLIVELTVFLLLGGVSEWLVTFLGDARTELFNYTKSHGIVPKWTHVKNIQCDSDFDVKSLVLKTMEYSLASMAILHHLPGIRSTSWTIW